VPQTYGIIPMDSDVFDKTHNIWAHFPVQISSDQGWSCHPCSGLKGSTAV